MNWKAWKSEFERLMSDGLGRPFSMEETGEQWYRDSHQEGYTPEEAFEEEKTYWEE